MGKSNDTSHCCIYLLTALHSPPLLICMVASARYLRGHDLIVTKMLIGADSLVTQTEWANVEVPTHRGTFVLKWLQKMFDFKTFSLQLNKRTYTSIKKKIPFSNKEKQCSNIFECEHLMFFNRMKVFVWSNFFLIEWKIHQYPNHIMVQPKINITSIKNFVLNKKNIYFHQKNPFQSK